MRPFAAVERFFERVFERPTARLFHARLQPIQLQRRLERAMENERLTSAGRTFVPNRYVIHLNPDDFAGFGDLAGSLAGELADTCLAYARQRHFTVSDRPQVSLVPDEAVASGEMQVATRFGGAPPEDGSAGGVPGDAAAARPGEADEASREGAGQAGAPERTMVFEVPEVRAPRARLRLIEPDGSQREVLVDGRPLTFGRATDNDVVVRDGRVSRHHARIQARGGALVLTDLGSTNGTHVNGVRVQEAALGEGDTIEVGDSALIVESTPAP